MVAKPELDDQDVTQALTTWMQVKTFMLKDGLDRYQTECPRCGQILHAKLLGRRKHLHMACEGKCGMSMLE